MEFSVSKSDLVRELGLTQGVVEKKDHHSDPFEHSGRDRRGPGLANSDGPGIGNPLRLPGPDQERGCGHDSGAATAGLRAAAA